MTLNCTHTLAAGGSSLLQKIINQQNLNHRFFSKFLGFVTSGKKFYHHIFFVKPTFFASFRFLAQVLKKVFRGLLSNRHIQWMKLTKRTHIHTKFNVLENWSGVRKWQNSSSGNDKTKIFIYKVPFTLHPVFELINNITKAKKQKKLDKSMPSKKSVKVSFVTSGTQKMRKKGRGISVFAPLQIHSKLQACLALVSFLLFKWFKSFV